MTDKSRSAKESGTQRKKGRGTGGLKVLRRKRDKDGKKGSSEGDKRAATDRKRLFRMPVLHTLSAGIRATRWLLTQQTQTLLGACRDVTHTIHIAAPQHMQTNTTCCWRSVLTFLCLVELCVAPVGPAGYSWPRRVCRYSRRKAALCGLLLCVW